MEARPANQPAPDVLRALVAAQLDSAAAEAASAHLAGCPACRESAAALSGDSFLRRLRAARSGGSTAPETRGTGDTQGSKAGPPTVPPTVSHVRPVTLPELHEHPQYEVLRELGRGGMGVVYLARNKLMDRQEVLKVVGTHLLGGPGPAACLRPGDGTPGHQAAEPDPGPAGQEAHGQNPVANSARTT
jgi:anti-sigma factor RsiW